VDAEIEWNLQIIAYSLASFCMLLKNNLPIIILFLLLLPGHYSGQGFSLPEFPDS
jgi:hypothetical protein